MVQIGPFQSYTYSFLAHQSAVEGFWSLALSLLSLFCDHVFVFLLFMVSLFTHYWVKNDQCIEKVLDQMMTLMKQVLYPSIFSYSNLFPIISDAAQPGDLLLQLLCSVTRWAGRQGANLHWLLLQPEALDTPAAMCLQSCSSFWSSVWVEASAVWG